MERGAKTVTLEMVYDEVKKLREEVHYLEDLLEAVLLRGLPEVELSPEELEEIRKSIEEMRRGEYVNIEELEEAISRT
ncbi:hypothetical protein B6U66_04010 [Candidatus Bathyarchaeota archaeon ex4484_135]|nr:MAG: hypothetical protein B6U66_04010 [Candidatus Bathyarchaeota archaeon ex4484_135]